uniref:Uncharacterized protein n=1 Tax=Elizabethkingia anophelis TaxID=1117645 RepID=A0A455ZG07_9FLAO|nr:TPA_exp: hypothetical protein [Elizabethkingia anophelis]
MRAFLFFGKIPKFPKTPKTFVAKSWHFYKWQKSATKLCEN